MPTPIERHLIALPRSNRQVYLSWRLLKEDAPAEPFSVERRRPGTAWAPITATPITGATDVLDETPHTASYEYRIVARAQPSRPVSVDTGRPATNLAAEFPLRRPPQIELLRMAFGDLTNDNRPEILLLESENGRVQVSTYTFDGKPLWEIDTGLPDRGGWDRRTFHVPIIAWDVNGDGRTEVIFHRGPGHPFPDNFYAEAGSDETLVAVDGETGEMIWEVPWPGTRPRVAMTVGYLNGFDQPPSVVVQDGTYGNEVVTAVDGVTGRTQWQVTQGRGAGHNLDIADVDEDGRQEVIAGGICYGGDGTILWEAEPFGHTDVSKPAKFLPDHAGLQTLYLVEKHNPGVYLVGADGQTIWKEPFGHAHWSWIGHYDGAGEQLMIHAAEKGEKLFFPIYHPDGRLWREITKHQAHRYAAVGWEADGVTCFAHRTEKHIVRLDENAQPHVLPGSDLPAGSNFGRIQIAADLAGDFRENFAAVDHERGTFFVAANPQPAGRRQLSPMEDFTYRHERSQIGSGYYTYICPPVPTSSANREPT